MASEALVIANEAHSGSDPFFRRGLRIGGRLVLPELHGFDCHALTSGYCPPGPLAFFLALHLDILASRTRSAKSCSPSVPRPPSTGGIPTISGIGWACGVFAPRSNAP